MNSSSRSHHNKEAHPEQSHFSTRLSAHRLPAAAAPSPNGNDRRGEPRIQLNYSKMALPPRMIACLRPSGGRTGLEDDTTPKRALANEAKHSKHPGPVASGPRRVSQGPASIYTSLSVFWFVATVGPCHKERQRESHSERERP